MSRNVARLPRLAWSAAENLVVDSFLFALPSRFAAAASLGNAARRGDATLHHRVVGTGSDRSLQTAPVAWNGNGKL
jgi:hypothetical protein